MRIKNLNNSGFSLLEILLSGIIFVVSVAGVFATLNAARSPVVNKEGALAAAVFGKQVLEVLRSQVSQTQANFYSCSGGQNPCPDFALSVGAHAVPLGNLPAGLSWPPVLVTGVNNNNPNGSPPVLSYTVSCADNSNPCGSDTAHRVDLNIQY